MEVTVNQPTLAIALIAAGRAVSTRNTLPVLHNILLDASDGETLRIAATNLEIGISIRVPAIISEPGAITVPSRLLIDLVERISDMASIRLVLNDKTQTLTLTTAGIKVNLKGIDAGDFPMIPAMPTATHDDPNLILVTLPAAQLRALVGRVADSASTDESRPTLTGVEATFAPNRVTFAATDGYRLSLQAADTTDATAHATGIIPAKSLEAMALLARDAAAESIARICLTANRNQAICQLTGATDKWLTAEIATQLIDARFPNYRVIIPTGHTTMVIVDTAPLIKSLRLAGLFARDNAGKCHIATDATAQTLTVTAKSANTGDNVTVIPAMIESPGDLDVCFNVKYILNALTEIDTPQTRIELTDARKPGVFLAVGVPAADQLIVIMPLQAS